MKLSENFTLAELTHSEAAERLHLDNTPPAVVIERLREVCMRILEPVRQHFGRATTVNSGYRSVAVNKAVKGASNSQHTRGEAVDFEIPGVANGDVAMWASANLEFDQLILEAYKPGLPSSGWVHCSWRATDLRREVMTFIPGRGYLKGLRL